MVAPLGALAFTPDGARLTSWCEDATIRFWDHHHRPRRSSLRLTHLSMGERDSVYRLVVTPDGKRVGAVEPGGVRFWDLDTHAGNGALAAADSRASARDRAQPRRPSGSRPGGDEPKIVVVDSTSGKLLTALTGFTGPNSVNRLQP